MPTVVPTPISTSDPILAAVAAAPNVTPGFVADVVDLINRSPNLLTEIDQLDATPLSDGGTAQIELQSGAENGGNTTYHSPVINIAALASYDDTTLPYYGGSLTAGQTQYLTPAGTFVGILGHEIGHWGDPQLGPLFTNAVAGYTLEQSVATEFASEGKAAFSQYTAMSQIEATEPNDPVPADMANGNILFDVTGIPINDTALLQHVQSVTGADPATADATIISYLGSQFWNVPVDSGTYISTMWDGFGASGARNDLGITLSDITGFQVTEAPDRTLAGCSIQTVTPSGVAWTYQIDCPTPGQQQASILDSASGALLATIGTVVGPAGADMQLCVAADQFQFAVSGSSIATVVGNGDTLTLRQGDTLSLNGSGNTVIGAAGNSVSLQAASTAIIEGAGGATVNLDGNAAAATVAGGGSVIGLFAGNDTVTASASAVTLAQASPGAVIGSDDSIGLSSQDLLTLDGTGDSVSGSGAAVVLSGAQTLNLSGIQDSVSLSGAAGGNVAISVSGGQDSVFGGAQGTNLQLSLSATGSMISLTQGNATITGGGPGTSVFGGASNVDYAGGGGILVMGGGTATVGGAAAGMQETVFGGSGGVIYQGGAEYADVIGGAGSCTIHAGAGGGWYGGGAAGGNFLSAGGSNTVLDAGGNGDTLVGAAGGGTYLIAGAGNETLYGGNQSGESSFFLGSGGDAVVAGSGGSVIDTGAGSASVYGGGGDDQIWGGSGAADLFVAGIGGQLDIHGFRTGTDHLVTGGQAVTGMVQGGGGTTFLLSSGATILLAGVETASAAAFV